MHLGNIQNGKLIFYNRERFNQDLRRLEGQKFQLTLEKLKKTRSDKQNRFLWAAVYKPISDYTGWKPDEIHEGMKWNFLRVERGELETVRSTTGLSPGEFNEYVENIRQWLVDKKLDIYIPTIDDFYGYSHQSPTH